MDLFQVKLQSVQLDVDIDKLTRKVSHCKCVGSTTDRALGESSAILMNITSMSHTLQVIRSFPSRMDALSVKYDQVSPPTLSTNSLEPTRYLPFTCELEVCHAVPQKCTPNFHQCAS